MSKKNYVSLENLTTFLDNLYDKLASIGHKHTINDITDYVVDVELSSTSTNPVQNKVIDAEFEAISTAMNVLEKAIDGKSDASHNHNDKYYTETEIDSKVATLNTAISGKSDSNHNHDDKYYTETEINSKLDGKSDTGHSHSNYVPTSRTVNGKALSGNITLSASDVGALPSNTEIPDALADLQADSTHRTVTDTEKATWNAKSNFSGSYNDLTDKPTIPSISGLATTVYVDSVANNKVDKVSGKGLSTNDYTTNEKNKLAGIDTGAQVNQNAFSNVVVGSTTIAADSTTDSLTIAAGTGISVSGDVTNDKVTITNAGVRSIATGSANGTISVNTNGTAVDVAVKGLGSAAYTASTAYDASGTAKTKADAALASAKSYTDTAISNLINSAPTTLDTLGEIAAAMKTNEDVVDALEQAVGTKANASDLTSHTGNKSNPHGVSLSQLGVTATAAELNIMDGVTATAAEINKLDGATVTTTELNYVSGVTSKIQTQLDAKAASNHTHGNITNAGAIGTAANKAVITTTNGVLTTGTVPVAAGGTGATTAAAALTNLGLTATAAEINILDGITATTTELNYVDGVTSNIQTQLNGKAASSHGTHVEYSTTAPVMDGTASVGSATTVARSDHKHPTDTSRAAKTDLDTHTSNTTAHITALERTNWGTAYTHSQAAHAPTNAEKNQNAFSNIAVSGQTTVAADTTTDTVTFVGSNVTITTDSTNDKVTFTVANGSTSAKGVVQLTNSTSSTSTTTAATPSSVKSAYDLANTTKTNLETEVSRAKAAEAQIVADNTWAKIYDSGSITSKVNAFSGIDMSGYKKIKVAIKCANTNDSAGSAAGDVAFIEKLGDSGETITYSFFGLFGNLISKGTTVSAAIAEFTVVDGCIICDNALRSTSASNMFAAGEGQGAWNMTSVGGGLLTCYGTVSEMRVSSAYSSETHYFGAGSRVIVWGCK